MPPQILAGTCSLSLWPHPRLSPGSLANADAILWSTGDGWRLHKLEDLALYAGPQRKLTALVARDKRLLRLPLELPEHATTWRLALRDAAAVASWLEDAA